MLKIPYKKRKNAWITVKRVDNPYGEGTESVISLGCTLKGDLENPTWKVHIPVNLIEDVVLALKLARDEKRPLDKAIVGKEIEYEEAIELFKTYGGD